VNQGEAADEGGRDAEVQPDMHGVVAEVEGFLARVQVFASGKLDEAKLLIDSTGLFCHTVNR